MDQQNPTCKILQWNCRGYYPNLNHLNDLIFTYEPECICLQELILGQRSLISLKGYTSSHSPGRGGAGLLIKSGIPSSPIQLQTTLQAVAATVFIGKQYTICSMYIPPHSRITQQDIEEVITQLPRPFLVLGDLNCRDPMWGDCVTTFPATIIKNILHLHDIGILNTGEPTHYHRQTDTLSCIDLSLCSSECLQDLNWQVKTPLPDAYYESDHFPIIISRGTHNTEFPGPPRFNFKKARWDEFTANTQMQEQHTASINERVHILTETIHNAASRSIPCVNPANFSKPRTPFWNTECESAKREKKRASRRFFRTKLQVDMIEYQRWKARLRRLIRQARRSTWKAYVSSINSNTTSSEMWSRVKKISGKYKAQSLPVVEDEQGYRQSDPQIVSELLADSLAEFSSGSSYSNEFKQIKLVAERKPLNFQTLINETYNVEFSYDELKSCLGECTDSSPGPDNISYCMIRNLHCSAVTYLLETYNQIWSTGQFPQSWGEAFVIPIKKPGKTGLNPKHYRPISLTSCLCKLMERMVSRRLSWTLENMGSLNPSQYGFRPFRSTLDPLIQLDHDIRSAFSRRHMVLAVSFDLEKAYDTTWRRGILEEMHRIGLRGNLPTFISGLLSRRSFKVRVGNSLSTAREQLEGVPQGSVLACLCFSLAINEIRKSIPNGIAHLLYVDDLLIYCEGGYLPAMERQIQHAINGISRWTDHHGYKFSTEKTRAMLFRHRGMRDDPNLSLCGTRIAVADEIKYLGLTFDPRLNWASHIKHLRISCQPAISLLSCLSHLKWGADRRTLKHIYQALVLSKLNYGSQIYASPTNKRLNALEPIQNKCLRLITGAFRSSPATSLQTECGIMSLENQRELGIAKLFFRLQQVPQSPATVVANESLATDDENWNFTRTVKSLMGNETLNVQVHPGLQVNYPPWQMEPVNVCQGVSALTDPSSGPTKQQLFLEHAELHIDSTSVYTDGSKSDGGVGSGVVVPSLSLSDSASLPKEASIFTAELFAIILGLELIRHIPSRNYTFYTDSRSASQALRQYAPKNAFVTKIKGLIHHMRTALQITIQFCWTPSHIGIRGNELADTIAKAAIRLPMRNLMIPYSDLIAMAKLKLRQRWQSLWDTQVGNKLHCVKPKVNKWESSFHKRRKYEVTVARLRIGHCNFSHIHLMLNLPAPQCCGQDLSVSHALVECPTTERIRLSLFPHWRNVQNTARLKELLSEDGGFNIEKLMELLSRLNLSNKI